MLTITPYQCAIRIANGFTIRTKSCDRIRATVAYPVIATGPRVWCPSRQFSFAVKPFESVYYNAAVYYSGLQSRISLADLLSQQPELSTIQTLVDNFCRLHELDTITIK